MSAKRRKVEAPVPKAIEIVVTAHSALHEHALYVADTVEDGLLKIRRGETEVVLIRKSTSHAGMINALEKDRELLFQWYNESVEPCWRVPVPTVAMIMDPSQHKQAWKPYINKGPHTNGALASSVMNLPFVNLYGSFTEDCCFEDANIKKVMEIMTGMYQEQKEQSRRDI